MPRAFILAGEASGDLHGSRLVNAMPDYSFFGVAGPRMREAGVDPLLETEDFQIMGFSGVIKALPRLRRQLRTCTEAILEHNPDVCILIDYAGFNMRLAKRLRKEGFKGRIVQYISPKVWAWGKGRIPKLVETLDLLLVIFPFETACFEGTDLPVHYVGNPLTEENDLSTEPEFLLGIFPGSRTSEIKLNLKRQLATAKALQKRFPALKVVVSVANDKVAPFIPPDVETTHDTKGLMGRCYVALATSGTVNLELALRKIPTVVVYRLSLINALLAALIFRIRLPFYCIVNICAKREVFPELIHYHFTPKKAIRRLLPLLEETDERRKCIENCTEVSQLLAKEHPSACAARLITQLAE